MTSTQHSPTTSPLAGVRVSDVMHPGVVTCLPDDGLAVIASMMATHGIHAVVEFGDDARPPIVTDRELVRAALERPDACSAEMAQEPVATVPASAGLDEAVEQMAERYVAHLLVTSAASGAPVGIVSSFDVAAVLGDESPKYARMLRPGPARPASSATTLAQAQARDVMHPGVTTCPPDVPLTAVARTMAQHRVHCVAVAGIANANQQLTWGLIGDMDVVRAVHRGAVDVPAATIAGTAPIAVNEDESLDRVAALMVEHDTSHVVVVGSSGLPSGVVSTLDVAAILAAG